MAVTAKMVGELRKMSAAPMMDCKNALEENDGNIELAMDYLRKKGIAKAAKKAGRETAEGRIGSYIHHTGKVAAMMELACETDFCAKAEAFEEFMKDVCMHIVASDPAPIALSAADIPTDVLDKEREIFEGQAKESGKPEQFWPKIIEGRMAKFVKEVALLEQPFIKDPDVDIQTLLADLIGKLGENISIRRFEKFQIG